MKPPRVINVAGAQIETEAGLGALVDYLDRTRVPDAPTIVVHSAGTELAELQRKVGAEVHTALGLPNTSQAAMDATTMVLCGLVNARVVAHLVAHGHPALGLCGADLGAMRSSLLNPERLGLVGGPPRINTEPLLWLLQRPCIVVVAPVCLGPDGCLVDVNADAVAQSLAVALGASVLEFVGGADGLSTTTGPIGSATAGDVTRLFGGPSVLAGMVPKLQATLVALEGGVEEVRIGSLASLTQGTGTVIRA